MGWSVTPPLPREEAVAGAGGLATLAGGTGFYLKALFEGLFAEPPLDPARRARLGGLDDRRLLRATAKTVLASLVMAVGVWGFLTLAPTSGAFVRGLGGIAIGAGLFGLTALALRIEEAHRLIGLIQLRRAE